MINHDSTSYKTESQFAIAIKELKIGKLLCCSKITKLCGILASEVFQFLLLLVFQGKNLFRFLNEQAVSKKPIIVS